MRRARAVGGGHRARARHAQAGRHPERPGDNPNRKSLRPQRKVKAQKGKAAARKKTAGQTVGRSESSAPSRQRPKSASPSSRERGRLNMVSRFALSCWDRALARPYEERIAGAGQQNPIVCEWDKGTVPLSHPPLPFAGRASPSGIPKSQRGYPRCPRLPCRTRRRRVRFLPTRPSGRARLSWARHWPFGHAREAEGQDGVHRAAATSAPFAGRQASGTQ